MLINEKRSANVSCPETKLVIFRRSYYAGPLIGETSNGVIPFVRLVSFLLWGRVWTVKFGISVSFAVS